MEGEKSERGSRCCGRGQMVYPAGRSIGSNVKKSLSFKLHWLVLSAATIVLVPEALFAQAPAATQPTPPPVTTMLPRFALMFVVVYGIFYLFVIRPQRANLVKQQQMLNTLKRGEQVITSSGIVGKVAGVEKEFATIEVAPNIKIKFEIAHITKRVDKAADKSADKPAA